MLSLRSILCICHPFSPEVVFELDTYADKSAIENAVKNVHYPQYRTFTGKAMTLSLKHYLTRVRSSPDVLKVRFIIYKQGNLLSRFSKKYIQIGNWSITHIFT